MPDPHNAVAALQRSLAAGLALPPIALDLPGQLALARAGGRAFPGARPVEDGTLCRRDGMDRILDHLADRREHDIATIAGACGLSYSGAATALRALAKRHQVASRREWRRGASAHIYRLA